MKAAMVVLRGGTHIENTKKSGFLAPVLILGREMKDRMAAEIGAL